MNIVEFKTNYDGRAPRDMVLIAGPGEQFEKTRTWHYIDHLRPKAPKDSSDTEAGSAIWHAQQRWSIIEPFYKAWKEGEEIPEFGTPLGAWGGVSQSQAEALKKFNIKTVEEFAESTEGVLGKLPFPNARKMVEMARNFLKSQDAAEKDREIADLKARLDALAEVVDATQPVGDDKPRRGRPRKVEQEAA